MPTGTRPSPRFILLLSPATTEWAQPCSRALWPVRGVLLTSSCHRTLSLGRNFMPIVLVSDRRYQGKSLTTIDPQSGTRFWNIYTHHDTRRDTRNGTGFAFYRPCILIAPNSSTLTTTLFPPTFANQSIACTK